MQPIKPKKDLMEMLAGTQQKVSKVKDSKLGKAILSDIHNSYDNPDFIPDRGFGAGLSKCFALSKPG